MQKDEQNGLPLTPGEPQRQMHAGKLYMRAALPLPQCRSGGAELLAASASAEVGTSTAEPLRC